MSDVLNAEIVEKLADTRGGWPGGKAWYEAAIIPLVRSHEALRARVVAAERERDAAKQEALDRFSDARPWWTDRIDQLQRELAAAVRAGGNAADALRRIIDELGVPGVGYPAPVANAVDIAREALATLPDAELPSSASAALRELVEFAESMDGPELRAWLVSQDASGTPGSERAAYIVHHVLAAREALPPGS